MSGDKNVLALSVAAGCVVVSSLLYWYRFLSSSSPYGQRQITPLNPVPSRYRFRKRDRMMYYGRKFIGKVKSAVTLEDKRQWQKLRKRERVLRFASRLFRQHKDTIAIRPPRRPPDQFVEADVASNIDEALFGHFELPFFLDVCRHIETKYFSTGQYIFQDGKIGDCIYMVQSGCLALFIKAGKVEFEVKKIEPGEPLYSSLTLLDMIKNRKRSLKNVSAKAVVDSVVLELRSTVFSAIFNKYPKSWVRTIQMILLRFQRVSLPALHNYFGFTTELMRPPGKLNCQSSLSFSPSISLNGKAKSSSLLSLSPSDFSPEDSTVEQISTSLPVGSAFFHLQDEREAKAGIFSAKLRKTVTARLAEIIELHDENALNDMITLKSYPPNHLIIQEGSMSCDLLFLHSGSLEVLKSSIDESGMAARVELVMPDELVGGLSALTNEPSFYTVRTKQQSIVAIINADNLRKFVSGIVALRTLLLVRFERFSSFVREADLALDWEICESGKALYRQGEVADSFYVVISGRLRSVFTKEPSTKTVLHEYGRGDIVSLVEVMAVQPRSTSVIAIRDTELCKLQAGLLQLVKSVYPQVLSHIIHLLGHCIGEQSESTISAVHREPFAHVANLNTIAVIAVSDEVPLTGFTVELWHSLNSIKSTHVISSNMLLEEIGPNALDRANEYQLVNWLSRLEDSYSIVLYLCDLELNRWTSVCIRRADCILIVANGESEPVVGSIEQQLEKLAVRAQKELILLWEDTIKNPKHTAEWLDLRGWVSSHYHVRFRKYLFRQRDPQKLLHLISRIAERPQKCHSDISRLARSLTSTSIGLILGGGGARGAAHVGVIKAIKELGIPIDIVGGVSIGAFVGGLYCMNNEFSNLAIKAKESFQKASSFWARIFDLTYPHSAMFTGSSLNRLLESVFDGIQIEDLWIPYFNITTDITSSEMRVHRSGKLWRYCRASMSYIGLSPPLCDPVDGHYLVDGTLWRYCRASMTLAGFAPPVCDELDGHLLLDGGYVNNLPADVMRSLGVRTVIAVDVGAVEETNFANYGDTLSGWWVLWNKINPWAKQFRVMNMAEIQSRLAYVSCVRQLEEVKKAPYCRYLRPPIDRFQTLDFKRFDEISEIGYAHGKSVLEELIVNDEYAAFFAGRSSGVSILRPQQKKRPWGLAFTSAQSFTDLAAMVAKIESRRGVTLDEGKFLFNPLAYV
ncbi:neuropathy target esterase [Trichuris trichiura]|uniref:Neuropathy target esterase n=1 Tax=Trichuris trichiura TaxID=36087 RepID=A0A077Z8A6_TRITR|nr:neuropathy target esterase [Trichuris trichiura]